MKKLFLSLIVILISTSVVSGATKPDMRFINGITSKVFGTPNPLFDPKKKLDDSIFSSSSSVYIARECIVDATREKATPGVLFANMDLNLIGETTVTMLTHEMILLRDAKAIKDFSEIVFNAPKDAKTASVVLWEEKNAFGARIFKPDGAVVNVDVSKAYPETEGKKNKAERFKLAIPSLEEGDVLELFFYEQYYFFGDQAIGVDLEVVSPRPVAFYRFHGEFDNILTTQFNTFNGLDTQVFNVSEDEHRTTVESALMNIERFDIPEWCDKKRQVPYFRVNVSDNVSRIFETSESAHNSGVFFNLVPPVIMGQIAEKFQKTEITQTDASKAWSLVKKFKKEHPEASENDIADAAWIAAVYVAEISEKPYNGWTTASLFKDIVDKAKLSVPAKLAVTTSHNQPIISEIASYDQASPLVMVGERPYIYNGGTPHTPGELAGRYQGEQIFLFDGKRSNVFSKLNLTTSTLPNSRAIENSSQIEMDVDIPDVSASNINFSFTNTLSGISKSSGAIFITSEDVVNMSEDFFNISRQERFKKVYSKEFITDRKQELLETMGIMDFDLDNISVESASIVNQGFLPGNDKFIYSLTGNLDGIISTAGEDLIIKIGALACARQPLDDTDKPRVIDIFTKGPYDDKIMINLSVPDGYYIDPETLQDLQNNTQNICGNFYTQASYDETTNKLSLLTLLRNSRRIHPLKDWHDFLDIREKANAFRETSIVLHKK